MNEDIYMTNEDGIIVATVKHTTPRPAKTTWRIKLRVRWVHYTNLLKLKLRRNRNE